MSDCDDDARCRKKKHKHKHKHHDRERRRKRDHDSDEDEPAPLALPPWHRMQFALIDMINNYAGASREIEGVRVLCGHSAGQYTDFSDFARLVDYVRVQFQIHRDASIMLRASVCYPSLRVCPHARRQSGAPTQPLCIVLLSPCLRGTR